ncbi:single-stranded-DNA-specific exonuclease RecJ [Candidatus Parcubacteria bacterium]|jgi:single-stranded-DNA-specific exonuclease|nr:single-stranded-DNA-specific exonuclease RecJ [Candidatus Parcubacteria bacterium]
MSHIWQQPKPVDNKIIEKYPELHPTVAQLLYNRGIDTQEKIDEFLMPDYSQDIHDPFLFKDMTKACERIYQAIDKKELITVYGDYDADGVSAAVILKTGLENLGAKVEAYLPHREKEGYGLNKKAVEKLASNKTKLIITCDCGISNTEEVDLANEKGLDVIITDHHTVPDNLPKAMAIIHPQVYDSYPFKFLAGGAVAFKLVQGLIKHKSSALSDKDKESHEKWLLDLVAISLVADMVPLIGENRTLLKYGLIVLKKTQRIGLQKLMEVANLSADKVDTRSIGFSIAPRINAAGRMDHANLAFYLLTEPDADKAQELAVELNQSNIDRQKVTEKIVRQADAQEVSDKESLLFFYQSDWAAGLTGLVASRLVRKHARPCIVMTDSESGDVVGSGRSIPAFNIVESLQANADLLLRFGGHPQACGFSISKDNKDKFISNMQKRANEQLHGVEFLTKLEIEIVINFKDISWEIVDLLDKFKPFGQGNAEPLFMSTDLLVTAARKVGNDAKHWKLELVKDNKKRDAIAFGLGNVDLEIGDKIDVVYNLSINQWNGNREIQLIIKDIKKDA